jgi:inhibitor of cysteine peptidase
MNRTIVIVCLGMICLIVVAFSGCVGSGPGNRVLSSTPMETPVRAGHLVVNETQNSAMVYMNRSSIITVRLTENPSTGFQWNLKTTPGLRIIKDEYVPTDTSGNLVGSGGTHIWDISTETIGGQEIHAVYKRSWEPTTGNESAFLMAVVVT